MLKAKIVSSQIKAFVDSHLDEFDTLERITALRGERLSVQLLYVDMGEPYMDVRPMLPVRLGGDLAPFATLRDVRSVPVDRPVKPDATDSQYLRTAPGIYPDILTPIRYGGKITVGREKLRSLWIEITIPTDARGDASLTVSVLSESGETLVECSITVDVIAATLPEPRLDFTQWFYCDCLANYYNVPVWSERHWEIVESFARVYADRGRNMIYTPLLTPALNTLEPYERTPTQLVGVSLTGGEYSFDFSLVDRWVDMCDRLGIKYLEISHFFHQDHALHSAKVYGTVDGEYRRIFGWETLALDPEYVRFLREMVVAFVAHMKARGDDSRCYYHVSDEPNLECLEHYRAVKDVVADLIAEYPIMDALSDFEFYKTGALTTPVPTTADAMPFIEAGTPDLWVYYACNQLLGFSNSYVSMPSWRTRSIGMQLYKYNIAGFLHWGYNYYNNRGSGNAINPYLDLGGEDWVPAGDTFTVYPAEDGTPLESLRSMSLYEAILDLAAMQLAEKYYSHDTVVAAMEAALGDEITFLRCAHTEREMLAVREAVNELIRRATGN